ncbi:MAG: TonB-dependent receptor [Leptolyngbya sp. SIO1E4]|nr:TonB-dependent receptor [Leptolyngbya sp. SIO1E4]
MEKWLSGFSLFSLLILASGQGAKAQALTGQFASEVEVASETDTQAVNLLSPTPPLPHSEFPQPATTVAEWMAQIEASRVQITNVRVESTDAGLQLILETADGELAAPTETVSGNALVAEIPNAVLALPEGDEFQQFEPAEGIALVQVTGLPGDRVQVVITGTDAVPVAEVSTAETGLTLSIVPGIALADVADDEALRVVVEGEEGNRYVEPNATTATRTDTPLRDIPQSIQVIPQEVLEDQQVLRLNDALRNVSGVVTSINSPRSQGFLVRGFNNASILRDGFRIIFGSNGNLGSAELSNLERIEVLKGPTSILSGVVEPGGAINLVSKQPLSEPAYDIGVRLGNRRLIEPSLDLTGPLTADGQLSYRLNALVRREEYFRDFDESITRSFVAPVLRWNISDRTDLTIRLEYTDETRPDDNGLLALGDRVADIPFDRNLGEPGDFAESETLRVGYDFEHRFSDNWRIRNAFRYTESDVFTFGAFTGFGPLNETTGDLNRIFRVIDQRSEIYELQTNIVGEFNTGTIAHKVLLGVDLFRRDEQSLSLGDPTPVPINIFNPVYGATQDNTLFLLDDRDTRQDGLGIYLQDQVTLAENLKLLLGIRYESVEQETTRNPNAFNPNTSTSSQDDEAFIPRVGIVYQPIEPVSLYASYAESFIPNRGADAQGVPLEPEEGQQFEVGVRAELLEGRLVANLALFDITKQNVATPDPNDLLAQIAIGEQRSQGIELDVAGEILPGWNIIANYAYTDTEITESNDVNSPEGSRLAGAPEHNFNLWTRYNIQSGSLEGLGLGLGFNYVGERFGDNANSFRLDDYFLTNAAISYERDNWQAALNFRNLFDVDYIEASTGTGRLFNIYPGEGFTVIGSFSIGF